MPSTSALGSPWVGGKALASASPLVLTLALAGVAAHFERGRRLEGGMVAVIIAAAVLWSNALQYHAVDLAPSGILSELADDRRPLRRPRARP